MKLIKSKDKLGQSRDFWRACPRALEFMPDKACSKGKPVKDTKTGKIKDEPECPWWINSEEHHYCFWKYLEANSNPDGTMRELTQSELAELFGWSNTKTHFMLKEAMEELTEALSIHGALELLRDLDEDDVEEIFGNDRE